MEVLNGLPKIPPTWSWSTINDACLKVQDGTHFSPQNQLAQGAYKYITAKNVRPSGLDLSNVSYLAEDEHRAIYKRCDPKKGDVLLVKDGVNTGDAAVNTLDEEFSLLSSVCLLRPRPALLYSQFLRYYLLSPVGYRMLTGQMTGTAIKRIILGRIKESPVPIAPLDEQRTIVAEIEKQFSRLDEAVATLKRVKANLKRYKAAVLKAAVEGKLTEDWRKQHSDIEPASKLLERILAERRAKSNDKGNYIESAPLDIDNLPALPKGWIWTSLGQMFEVYVGATPSRGRQEYWDGSIPWVSSGEVAFCRIRKTKERITEKGLANSSAKLHPQGTVLLGMIGEGKTRGQVAILDIAACNNQNSAAIRVSETGIPSEYVYRYLEGQYEENRLLGSGNNQPALNKARVQRIPLPLPPTNEQQQIVGEVERRLSVIDELEAAVQANLTRVDRLRQAILQRAFCGELHIEKKSHL
ncbi:MAG: restriction endonuclease subunit S [Nitrospira sp.]|nr:restriction endonuclease subunit S [Nitrospira sp.]